VARLTHHSAIEAHQLTWDKTASFSPDCFRHDVACTAVTTPLPRASTCTTWCTPHQAAYQPIIIIITVAKQSTMEVDIQLQFKHGYSQNSVTEMEYSNKKRQIAYILEQAKPPSSYNNNQCESNSRKFHLEYLVASVHGIHVHRRSRNTHAENECVVQNGHFLSSIQMLQINKQKIKDKQKQRNMKM